MKLQKFTILLAAIFIIVGLASADTVVQVRNFDSASGHQGWGKIDWSEQTLYAGGIGKIDDAAPDVSVARGNCISEAKSNARKNLAETVYAMNLNGETDIGNLLKTSTSINEKVLKSLDASRQMGIPIFITNGTCEIIIGTKFTGGLSDTILPNNKYFGGASVPNGAKRNYTGLIIDARDIDVTAALLPKIVDEIGNTVYGASYISREKAVESGAVIYMDSMELAGKKKDRIGENPLVIRASRVSGGKKTDIVISNGDAARLRETNMDFGFLRDARVIVVI